MKKTYDCRIVRYHYCFCVSLASSIVVLASSLFSIRHWTLVFLYLKEERYASRDEFVWIFSPFHSGVVSFSFDQIFMFELWHSMKNSIITPVDEEKFYRRKIFGGLVWTSFSLMFEELDWSNSIYTQNEAILKSSLLRRKGTALEESPFQKVSSSVSEWLGFCVVLFGKQHLINW